MARRLKARVLVVLVGLPGAGKSTLARALCRARSLARIDRDAIRLELFPDARFTAAEKAAANAEVWRRARRRLARGESVVIDGMTFASRAQRRHAQRLARTCGARCVEVFLDCPAALARERVDAAAGHPAGDRSARLVTEVAARFERASRRALRLDARHAPRALARRAAAAL